MIKFTGDLKGGGRLIGLGLSRSNCERLLDHKPINIDMRQDLALPWNGKIVLLADETEQALTDSLRDFIDEDTIMHIDPRLETPPPSQPTPLRVHVSAARDDAHGTFVMFDFGARGKFGLSLEQARALAILIADETGKAEKL